MTIIQEQKLLARDDMKKKLSELDSDQVERWSIEIRNTLWQHSAIQSAKVIAAYYPRWQEVDIRPFLRTLNEQQIVFPRMDIKNKTLEFRIVTDIDALPVSFPEPDITQPLVNISNIDVILIPGVAFDRKGGRLGRGLGYYDRALSKASPHLKRIGVCFDMQVIKEVPHEDHDVFLDEIITEREIIRHF